MADNIILNAGSGGKTLATDQVSGIDYQINKLAIGDKDTVTLISDLNPLPIKPSDASQDAFSRLRVSNPKTIFDSKQLYDNAPLFWDDQEESGSGTTSTHSINKAASSLAVALNTAGKRTRQTYMRFNYQPGKSQLVFVTGILNESGGGSGITTNIGLFDDNNGLFFQDKNGIKSVIIRSNTSGSVVDTVVTKNNWDDPLDGTGRSAITIDFTKTQIFVIDFQWLGVGRIRFGFNIGGIIVYCHLIQNANVLSLVYMSTPNLPIRIQIENDGTGQASSLSHICVTIISEGGNDETGIIRYKSVDNTVLNANTTGTLYLALALRLKSTALSSSVSPISASIMAVTNDDFEWVLLFNPTIAGTLSWIDEVNSSVQIAKGDTPNTVSGGVAYAGGYEQSKLVATANQVQSARRIGANINNVADVLALCVRPLSVNADILSSLQWRELS